MLMDKNLNTNAFEKESSINIVNILGKCYNSLEEGTMMKGIKKQLIQISHVLIVSMFSCKIEGRIKYTQSLCV
jgi:hypothetical protein